MTKITVLDAPMGAGKSTAIINMLNKRDAVSMLQLDKYIIATPYLDEVKRFKTGITARHFYEPQTTTAGGVKRNHFRKLVEEGKDIATTHALIGLLDAETMELIKSQGYTIVIDEDMDAHKRIKSGKNDIADAIKLGYISLDEETQIITWIGDADYEGAFDYIKEATTGSVLYKHNDTTLVQTLSANFYEAFTQVYLLNYLFETGDMWSNLMLNDIPFVKKSIRDGEIVDYDASLENRQELRALINVYDGELNKLCEGDVNPFNSTFYNERTDAKQFAQIKRTMSNVVRNIYNVKSKDVMWTTLKSHQAKLKGDGYAKGFVSLTQKASNDYADKSVLLYMYNRFGNPYDFGFYKSKGVVIDEELWACASMLQWVFRSRVRKGEQVELYMPSERMRNVLDKWASYEI